MRTDSEDIIKLKASLLKTSVSLANSTAKFAFLSLCLSLGIIPFGFKLKFSLQSGLPSNTADGYDDRVKEILDRTSLDLLITAKEGEAMKISYLNQQILDTFSKLEDKEFYANLAVSKFRKILLLRIKIHQNKLKKLLNGTFPPMFIDVDKEITSFEAKLFSENSIALPTSSTAHFDWFDESCFPSLPFPSRRDWTEDLEIPCSSSSLDQRFGLMNHVFHLYLFLQGEIGLKIWKYLVHHHHWIKDSQHPQSLLLMKIWMIPWRLQHRHLLLRHRRTQAHRQLLL